MSTTVDSVAPPRTDLVKVVSLVLALITTIVGGFAWTSGRIDSGIAKTEQLIEQHTSRPHPGVVTQVEYERLLVEVRRMQEKLDLLLLRQKN